MKSKTILTAIIAGIMACSSQNPRVTKEPDPIYECEHIKVEDGKEKKHNSSFPFSGLEDMRDEISTLEEMISVWNKEFEYVPDVINYEQIEFRASPLITLKKRSGDCEDAAMLFLYCLQDDFEDISLFHMNGVTKNLFLFSPLGTFVGTIKYEEQRGHLGCIANENGMFRFISNCGISDYSYVSEENLARGHSYNHYARYPTENLPSDWENTGRSISFGYILSSVQGYEELPEISFRGPENYSNNTSRTYLMLGEFKDRVKLIARYFWHDEVAHDKTN